MTLTPEELRDLAGRTNHLRHTHWDVWEALLDTADALEAQQAELEAARKFADAFRYDYNRLFSDRQLWTDTARAFEAYEAARVGQGDES